MIVTCHSKTLESSHRPAEKPSTGFFESSAGKEARSEFIFKFMSRCCCNVPKRDTSAKNTAVKHKACLSAASGEGELSANP